MPTRYLKERNKRRLVARYSQEIDLRDWLGVHFFGKLLACFTWKVKDKHDNDRLISTSYPSLHYYRLMTGDFSFIDYLHLHFDLTVNEICPDKIHVITCWLWICCLFLDIGEKRELVNTSLISQRQAVITYGALACAGRALAGSAAAAGVIGT